LHLSPLPYAQEERKEGKARQKSFALEETRLILPKKKKKEGNGFVPA